MSRHFSRAIAHFRKDHSSTPDASRNQSVASSSTTSPTASRTATFSTTATASTTATSVQAGGSAHSSRRTSVELAEKAANVSDAPVSQHLRAATGQQTNAGDALHDAKLLAEAGVSLCSLAGYSRSKTMRLLQAMPEYSASSGSASRIPSTLNVEALFRGVQQRRAETYLTYVDFDGVDPLMHRIKADDILFAQFGDQVDEYDAEFLTQELQNWRYTWHDEITILAQHDETARADALREAMAPYNDTLDGAIAQVQQARARRLRGSLNLERFNNETNTRREAIKQNLARKETVRSAASGTSSKSAKSNMSNVTEKSLGRTSPQAA